MQDLSIAVSVVCDRCKTMPEVFRCVDDETCEVKFSVRPCPVCTRNNTPDARIDRTEKAIRRVEAQIEEGHYGKINVSVARDWLREVARAFKEAT